MSKKILIIFSFITVFCLTVLVWYAPVMFKGYILSPVGSYSLIKARNFSLTNKNSTESELNVILSSELISSHGQESFSGNKLGPISYSYLFKFFNITNNNSVVLINCIILAVALLIFGLMVYYLFGYKIFLFFSLIYIFLPSNWLLPQFLVGYEFALLYLSFFFLFFALGTKRFTKDIDIIRSFKFWPQGILLILSGIFLTLACLAKETFLILLLILFIFLLITKLKKYFIYIFVPIIILFVIFWLPGFIKQENTYLLFFTDKTSQQLKSSDYSFYGHLFPDPYTYYFDQKDFLEENYNLTNADTGANAIQKWGMQKVMANMGYLSTNLWQRIKIGTPILARHIFRFFSITEIGGVLIFILSFLGFYVLKKQKNCWSSFSIFWILGTVFLLAYVNLVVRNHLMDFGWIIALTTAFGTVLLAELFNIKFKKPRILIRGNKQTIIEILLLALVIYNLVLCGHVMWGQKYDNSPIPFLTAHANEIKNYNINNSDIIAVSFSPSEAYNLNFITNKSIIVFKPETIEKLLTEQKLSGAFDKFNVKYILGYSPELSQQIIKTTNTQLIADSSLPVEQENLGASNKNWFMNLVK